MMNAMTTDLPPSLVAHRRRAVWAPHRHPKPVASALEMICLIRLTRLRLAALARTAAVAPTAPPLGCRTMKTSAWGNRTPDGTHSTSRKPAAPHTRSTYFDGAAAQP